MDISPSSPKKKKIKIDTNNKELPLELESNILTRLSTKEVVGCECICKRWRDEIKSPNLIKSHTQHNEAKTSTSSSCSVILYPKLYPNPSSTKVLSMDFDDQLLLSPSKEKVVLSSSSHYLPTNLYKYVKLIGSSKGLLCFRNFELSVLETRYWLHNPATGACTTIPRLIPKKSKAPKVNCVKMLGFGHDSKTNDFKILCSISYIVNESINDDEYNVYSLKNNSWKYIEPVVVADGVKVKVKFGWAYKPCILTFSNNALHFMGCSANNNRLYVIYAFDLAIEEFHQVPLLDMGAYRVVAKSCLFDIKGCLHATMVKFTRRPYDTSIRVMKKYRSKQSWTKVVDFDGASLRKDFARKDSTVVKLCPLAYSADGSKILIGISDTLYITAIVECDLQTSQVNKLLPPNLNCDHDDSQRVEPFDFPFRFQVMLWSVSLRNPIHSIRTDLN